MKLFGKYKTYIFTGLTIIAFCSLMFLFGIPCPIKYLTGISCAGCGMSRACLSAIRLDFDAAFHYHPLWVAIIPAAASLVILHANNKRIAFNIAFVTVCIVFVAVWLFRMIFIDSDIVAFHLEEGLFSRIVQSIKDIISS